jgi:hypothetical protein
MRCSRKISQRDISSNGPYRLVTLTRVTIKNKIEIGWVTMEQKLGPSVKNRPRLKILKEKNYGGKEDWCQNSDIKAWYYEN